MLFFLRSFFIQLFLNAFIVYRIWKSHDLKKGWKIVLIILYGLETVMYFTGLLAGYRLPIEVYSMIQQISGLWVVAQGYLVFVILVFDAFFMLSRRFHFFSFQKEKRIRRIKGIVFLFLLLFIGWQFYTGYSNFIHPETKHYPVSFGEKTSDRAPKHYRMLVAADLHLGYIVNASVLERFVEAINAQHPDIIVIDGDLIDYELRPLIIQRMDSILRRLSAPKGVFFVPGNHEYKLDPEVRLQWIAKHTGMTVLRDSIVVIDESLCLIGRDDRQNRDNRMSIEALLEKTDSSLPRILFAHQPGDIPDSYKHNIPLTICGHTHCGQVFPGNLIVKCLFPNGYGWQYFGLDASYTTSGLGLSGFPLRISNRSEMVVFDITIY